MSAFEKLKSSMSDILSRTEVYERGSSLVPKPNESELVARLKPEDKGREQGRLGLPAASSSDLDEYELKIIETMQEMADATSQDVNEALATYNERLSSLNLSGKLGSIRSSCSSGVSEFITEIANGENFLVNYRDDVVDRAQDLKEFRRSHRLKRTAIYPESGEKILKWGLIVFFFAIELIGNSVFLSKSNEMGVVGASMEAFYISVLNIGTALLLGVMIVRGINHRSILRKLMTYLFLIPSFLLAVFFNLLVGHYREVAGSGLFGEAGEMAIESLLNEPFSLDSFAGWILFSVGLLFWIITLIDSYTLDDAYPGYGVVTRRARDAKENYASRVADIIEGLRENRDREENSIADARDELDAILGRIGTLKTARSVLESDFDIFRDQLEKICARTVGKYRSANKSERTDVPASFELEAKLSFRRNLFVENPLIGDGGEAEAIHEARELLNTTIDEFYEKYNAMVENLDSLTEVLERKSDINQ